jgi:hypothetical protein
MGRSTEYKVELKEHPPLKEVDKPPVGGVWCVTDVYLRTRPAAEPVVEQTGG